MLLRPISSCGKRLLVPRALFAHSKTCPAVTKKKSGKDGSCEETAEVKRCASAGSAGAGSTGGGGGVVSGSSQKLPFKRALHSGTVRFGFLPDGWFTFFYNKTGVTGPYLFLFNLTNYLLSKEIYVLEHEFYLGISAFVMVFYATKTFGKDVGLTLDKKVDEYEADLQKGRNMDIEFFNNAIKMAKDCQRRAEGQKLLMDAKKENVAMQLEAIYRERAMIVYRSVRARMDYHIKLYQAEARIQQKWMLGWILESVHKSITPEFLKQALQSAISDLANLASQAKS